MSKRKPPSQEAFEKLLAWLGPDRDRAAKKYSDIHLRLVRILAGKGCSEAEDLADQTINVVANKPDDFFKNYRGDPALYFYGVNRKIYQEWLNRHPPPPPLPQPDREEIERRCDCLEKCLQKITTPEEARMVVRYHEGEGQARIENRRKIAEELGITQNALRIRICHLQARLRPCIEKCLRELDR